MSDTSNTSDMRGRLGAILNAAAAAATPAGQALRTKGVAKMQALCPAECDYVRRGFWRDMRVAIPDLPDGDRVATLHATPPGGKGKKYYPKPARGLFQSMGVATMAFAIEARHMTLRAWRALFGLASDAMVLSYDAVSAVSPEWQRDFARRCYEGLCSFWLHQDQNREVYTGVAEWVQGVLYITGTGRYGLRTQVWGPKDGETPQQFLDRFRKAFPLAGMHYEDQTKLANMVKAGASRVERLTFAVQALAKARQDLSHTDLNIPEKQWLERNATCHELEVEAGEVFFWLSGLPHANVVLKGPTDSAADYQDVYRILVNAAPLSVFGAAELATRAEALRHEGQAAGHAVARHKQSWRRRPDKPSMKRFKFGLAKDERGPGSIRKVAARDSKRNALLRAVGTVKAVRAKQDEKVAKWKKAMAERKAAMAKMDPLHNVACWETQLFPKLTKNDIVGMRNGMAYDARDRAPYARGFADCLADPEAFWAKAVADGTPEALAKARLVALEAHYVAAAPLPSGVKAMW